MKIATLGPQGTYSEQAALLFAKRLGTAPDQTELIFCSANHSLRLVQNRSADYAVLPVENMIDGLIGSTFDALIEFHDFVKVCDEVHLPINHVLAGSPGVDWASLAQIYSHPSALNQCQDHLEELFPGANLVPVLSTAVAIQAVLNDPTGKSGAICNREAALQQQLVLFGQEIQDYPVNQTRFLVCSLGDSPPTGNDRTLLAVRYGSNQPGQLYQTAKYFAEAEINLTFVQSRPYKVKPQEYVIILEFIGHKSNPEVEMALRNIELQVRDSNGWKKILGSYPKRESE